MDENRERVRQRLEAYKATQRATARRQTQIREQVRARVLELFDSLPDLHRGRVDSFVASMVPLIEAGQLEIASLSVAHIQAYAEAYELTADALGAGKVAGYRGPTTQAVYQRIGPAMYAELANGVPLATALATVRERLDKMIQTDMQAAKVRGYANGLSAYPAIKRYRRVLNGSENCMLCVLASTRAYYRDDLLPIHPGCDCGVEPLPPNETGYVLDARTVERVHEVTANAGYDIGENRSGFVRDGDVDYTKIMAVHEHGETGPMLVHTRELAGQKRKRHNNGWKKPNE